MREETNQRGLKDRARELLEKVEGEKPAEPAPRPEGPRGPGEVPDAEGEGSIWDRVAEVADIAPVQGNPSLEPANEPWEVAMMAGWGNGTGYDSMMGVGDMVTGDVDANQELQVESATEGSPLQLGMEEDMDTRLTASDELSYEEPGFGDWTTHL